MRPPNFNIASVLSHIRRVCTPLDRVGRGSRPRQLHPTHYGYLCPVETPEGPACGLIKGFALSVRVTHIPSPEDVRRYRAALAEALPDVVDDDAGKYVMLNGDIVGRLPPAGAAFLEFARRSAAAQQLLPTVFAAPADGNVYIFCDEARVVRPLLVVVDGDAAVVPVHRDPRDIARTARLPVAQGRGARATGSCARAACGTWTPPRSRRWTWRWTPPSRAGAAWTCWKCTRT